MTGTWTGAGFWQAGLVAGLRVGQAYGVFYRSGFGLVVLAPRSLSTQPPFATQALTTRFSVQIALYAVLACETN